MTTGELPRRDNVELHRQRALESLQLSEHARSENLDRLTRLARTTFDVAMSTVTVLDGDRAHFPGAAGLDLTDMPREETFCDRTTAADRVLLVEDATLDDRFNQLQAVREGGIRFYAGHPLRDSMGHVLGVFCLYDTRPRRLEGDLLVAFEDMAAWAQQELVTSAEMQQAGRVQASMLPLHPLRTPGWEVAGLCLPALAVGGDFYDHGLVDGVLHLVLGDVMGKGTGAALVGAGVRAALRAARPEVTAGADLGQVATRVARSLMSDLDRAESFVTLFEAAVDVADGAIRFVDAGAGLSVLVDPDGTVHRLGSNDRPFGILDDDHWSEHRAAMSPGSRLLVLSDGILDLLDDPLRWWEAVADLVRSAEDPHALLAALERLARERTPLDDITAVAVYRDPSTSP